MDDIEEFRERLEQVTDFVRRFPSFRESVGELAEKMGYVDRKTAQKREMGVATLILLAAIRKIIARRSRNAPGIRSLCNAKHPHLSQEPIGLKS